MKKAVALFLILLLCISNSLAEIEIDISNFSDAELIALLEKIETSLMERNLQRTARLGKGTYVCGKDFPAGGYDILLPDDSKEQFVRLFAYSAARLESNGKTGNPDIIDGAFLHKDEAFHVYLSEGDRIDIAADVLFTISNPIIFE